MSVTQERKKEIFASFGGKAENTGGAESQVALFTERIAHLTGHLKTNKKDFSTQKSLIAMVGKRRSLLNYLKAKDIERYRAVIKTLNLRK